VVIVAAIGVLAFEIARTAPVRGAVQCYSSLLVAANRQDLAAARELCSNRYLQSHGLRPAAEGGLVGLPRNINKNFQAWKHGSEVWLCPTNRVGPVYQFVNEGGAWRFDGPIGVLTSGGTVERLMELEGE
jgi:hypothetical protein